jgi:hypothetical protein
LPYQTKVMACISFELSHKNSLTFTLGHPTVV